MHFLIVLGLIGCAIAAPSNNNRLVPMLDGRIVGGSAVDISNFPYQLSLQYFGSHICGAVIISSNWALTAAHCVEGSFASLLSVRAGSSSRGSGGTVYAVSQVITHSQYSSWTLDNDIALLRVNGAFNIGSTGVNSVALPSAGSTPNAGVVSVVSGWGTLSSGSSSLPVQLQAVEVPIVSKADCRRSYGTNSITDRMLCAGYTAGGRDACQGDSGGPLVANGVLVGLVSWGYGCAVAGYPGVYTDVGVLRNWVSQNSGV